ncbi:hypothetical protein A2U01_0115775, partial [Trifolium medium]|nr:hypothetical protein [Trifolium medium]
MTYSRPCTVVLTISGSVTFSVSS